MIRGIKEFKEKENAYNDFYKEETRSIRLYFFYVNTSNTLDSIKSDSLIPRGERCCHERPTGFHNKAEPAQQHRQIQASVVDKVQHRHRTM